MVRMLRSNTISCTQTRPRPCQSISANERKSDWCRQKKIVSNQDRCSGHIRLESVEMHIYEYESRQFTWNQQIKNVPEDWSRLPQPKSCRHADRSLPGNSHVQFFKPTHASRNPHILHPLQPYNHTLLSQSAAWPCSSKAMTMTAAPYLLTTRRKIRSSQKENCQ